jgi:hypothetical protein
MVPIDHSSQSAAGEATEIVSGHEPARGGARPTRRPSTDLSQPSGRGGHGPCPPPLWRDRQLGDGVAAVFVVLDLQLVVAAVKFWVFTQRAEKLSPPTPTPLGPLRPQL